MYEEDEMSNEDEMELNHILDRRIRERENCTTQVKNVMFFFSFEDYRRNSQFNKILWRASFR